MANLSGFNAHNVQPASTFEPLPAGKYTAIIAASEMKPTKSGTGEFLELKFQIVDGQYKSRTLWSRLNLVNANPQAVSIAQGELSAICRAVGVMTPNDSVELHNIPLELDVKCKKDPVSGEIRNEIKGYYKRSTQAPAPAAAEAPKATPPWMRKTA